MKDAAELFEVVGPPAGEEEIRALEKFAGGLPATYVALLRQANGTEACVHDSGGKCLTLWPAGEIEQLNNSYEIARWCPTLLAIGSNGGSDAIGFDRQPRIAPDNWRVVRIPFGDLDSAEFVVAAENFETWTANEFRMES